MSTTDLEALPDDDQKALRAMVEAAYQKAPELRAKKAAMQVSISADPALLERCIKAETEAALLRVLVDELRAAVGMAYGYLWCVNNEPGTPHQYPPERAAYEARKLLRDTMTTEQRGHYINAVLPMVRGMTPN